jgi:hypothetical protein
MASLASIYFSGVVRSIKLYYTPMRNSMIEQRTNMTEIDSVDIIVHNF